MMKTDLRCVFLTDPMQHSGLYDIKTEVWATSLRKSTGAQEFKRFDANRVLVVYHEVLKENEVQALLTKLLLKASKQRKDRISIFALPKAKAYVMSKETGLKYMLEPFEEATRFRFDAPKKWRVFLDRIQDRIVLSDHIEFGKVIVINKNPEDVGIVTYGGGFSPSLGAYATQDCGTVYRLKSSSA